LLSVPAVGTSVEKSLLGQFDLDLMSAIQMVILGLVTLLLGLFVVKPVLSRAPEGPPEELTALPAGTAEEGAGGLPALPGQDDGEFDLPPLDMAPGLDGEMGGFSDLPMMGEGGGPADPVERLRGLIEERQEETAEILRSWLEDSEERA
jgi:flagellar M-ring protein FliF